MISARRPLTPELASRWAASAQYHFLDALMADPQIQYEQIAFHGGTSLHFSWRSPRLSEDLDFLIARSAADLNDIVGRAGQKLAETFHAEDPQFTIEIQDRTRQEERMISFDLRVTHAAYLGKALIKVEFWRVSPEYLAQYPVELRSPIQPGERVSRISNPVPAATLETAYCDKLTALATRPYLKWRDIFDLWWIGTQTDVRLELSSVTRQFLHNLSAYRTIDGLPPAQALRKFLESDPSEVLNKADPDLRRWLPKTLWEKLHPRVTAQMVEYARGSLESVADAIEKNRTDGTLKRVRQ
jgi:predicted nucleotidyltransferase component of viral defense system